MTSSDSRSPDRMRGLTRRSLLKGGAALVALHASRLLSPSAAAASAKPRVAVVGAGAFGGWTALHLVRRGARVVLLDAWGPGNSRASSGGETRVIRATYGPDRIYVEMAARSLPLLRAAGLPVERLETAAAAARYPQIDFAGVSWVLHEKEAGYLLARRACQAVLERFQAEGANTGRPRSLPGLSSATGW